MSDGSELSRTQPDPLTWQDLEISYARLPRALPDYRWWRPLLALGLAVVFIVVATVIWLLALFTIAFTTGILDFARFDTVILEFTTIDASSPFNLVVMIGSVAIWIPCILLATRLSGMRPVAHLSSVSLKLRWRWLLSCLVPASSVMAFTAVLMLVVGPLVTGEPLHPITIDPGLLALNVGIILLLVPLQSAAEEYAFRGLLFQAIGSWIRVAWVAMLVTTVAFASLHLYDIWGLVDVAVFGVVAAWLAWRTGGLEAAIVMHAMNNVVLFVILATGVTGGTAVEAEGSGPVAILLTLITMVAYAFWIDHRAKARGITRSVLMRVPVS